MVVITFLPFKTSYCAARFHCLSSFQSLNNLRCSLIVVFLDMRKIFMMEKTVFSITTRSDILMHRDPLTLVSNCVFVECSHISFSVDQSAPCICVFVMFLECSHISFSIDQIPKRAQSLWWVGRLWSRADSWIMEENLKFLKHENRSGRFNPIQMEKRLFLKSKNKKD